MAGRLLGQESLASVAVEFGHRRSALHWPIHVTLLRTAVFPLGFDARLLYLAGSGLVAGLGVCATGLGTAGAD